MKSKDYYNVGLAIWWVAIALTIAALFAGAWHQVFPIAFFYFVAYRFRIAARELEKEDGNE